MFGDRYKSEIDNIKADGYVKQKILKKLQTSENVKTNTKPMVLRYCVSFALIAVIIVSAFSIIKFNNTRRTVSLEKSYDDIYNTISKFKINPKYSYYTDEEAIEDIADDAVLFGDSAKPDSTKGDSSTNTSAKNEVSETNEQVKGVDEADIVKTDGKYIYVYSPKKQAISIVKAGKDAKKVSQIELEEKGYYFNNEMFVKNGRLIFITRKTVDNKGYTTAMIYNVEKPETPQKLYECRQSGEYNTSRLIGNAFYVISNYRVNTSSITKNECATYVPLVVADDVNGPVSSDSIYIGGVTSPVYTVVCGYSIESGKLLGTQSVLGGTYTVYCSTENIITASYNIDGATKITRFALNNGEIQFKAEGEIKGNLLNQFSVDEHNGYFRFVTTENKGVETKQDKVVTYKYVTTNSLRVLDGGLKEVGKIEDIAPDENLYSVRFMGDVAYFVTFRQVDPLFSADLKDPKNPKIIGELKIPGFSNFLFPFGEGKLLGIGQDADEKTGRTGGIKFSIFDTSNPANVTESAKTILKYRDSDALYNHKASLVDAKRNIVGLQVWWQGKMQYNIYTLKDGSFENLVEFKLEQISDFIRGLYINDEFYVVTDSVILIHDLDTFEKVTTVEL